MTNAEIKRSLEVVNEVVYQLSNDTDVLHANTVTVDGMWQCVKFEVMDGFDGGAIEIPVCDPMPLKQYAAWMGEYGTKVFENER